MLRIAGGLFLFSSLLGAQITIVDEAGAALIAAEAVVETLSEELQFCEGPVWIAKEQALIFSDIPAGKLMRWTAKDGVVEWKPSEQPNGNTLDRQGRLLTCQHAARNLVRHEADGSLTVVVDRHDGKLLNSPNDVVVRNDGTIWFTDPTYGLGKREREQPGSFVYRLDPKTAETTVVQRDFHQPNGLCFSPDHRRLYIADSGEKQRVGAFAVKDDGTLSGPLFWLPGGSDGMRCDEHGNLYVTARTGVRIHSPQGELLVRIDLPQSPTNCAFGGEDGKTLFVTARKALYRVAMKVEGARIARAPAAPPKTWSLGGRVVGEDGAPLAGCTVRVTGHQATGHPLHWSWLDWRNPDAITTDADGRFRLELPAMPGPGIADGYPARLHIVLEMRDRLRFFGTWSFTKFFDGPDRDVGDISLPAGVPVRFRVVDGVGLPQRGVLLDVTSAAAVVNPSAAWRILDRIYERTDAHGFVSGRSLPNGRAKIDLPEVAGWQPRFFEADTTPIGAAVPVQEIEVPRGTGDGPEEPDEAPARLQFLVRLGGEPVEDLALHLWPLDGGPPVRIAERYRGGVALVGGLRETRYAVRVHARSGAAWPSDWLRFDATAIPTPTVVELQPLVPRTLHVIDAAGLPATGCQVELVESWRLDEDDGPLDARHGYRPTHRTMTEQGPKGLGNRTRTAGVLADSGTTDAHGAVSLVCRASDRGLAVRVTGGDVQRTIVRLPSWHAGSEPIVVRVARGARLRGSIAPADFVAALDCADDDELRRVQREGVSGDPWGRSLNQLRAESRPGIALRKESGMPIWDECVVPLAEDGSFAIAGMPAGDYEVVLVVRVRKDSGGKVDEIVEPALGKVTLRVGQQCVVRHETPLAVRERMR